MAPHPDTADGMFGMPDPTTPQVALAGPGTVGGTPAFTAGGIGGLRAWHPAHSATPWVVGMFLILALLFHPKLGFNAGGRVGLG
jgi:hypothetical protein